MIEAKIRTRIVVACIPLLAALIVLAVLHVSTAPHQPTTPPTSPGPGIVQEHHPDRMQAHLPARTLHLDPSR